MKTKITLLLLVVATAVWAKVTPGVTLTTYYSNANNKSGNELRTALETIISTNYNTVSYDNIGYLLKYADTQNADGLTIVDIYSECTNTTSATGDKVTWGTACSGSAAGNVGCDNNLNREHSLPQSWFAKASPMVSDAFHIYSVDAVSNGHRSDHPYGECSSGTSYSGTNCNESGKLGTSTFSGASISESVYEPIDEYKGDIARGYFYMITRYRTISFNQAASGTSDDACFSYTDGQCEMTPYMLALMLKWHRQDPVSDKERIRNEVIYGNSTYHKGNTNSYAQHNRNPFIDYPELVEYIWGNKSSQTFSLANAVSAYSDEYINGGGSSEGGETTTYDVIWMINGELAAAGSQTTSVAAGGRVSVLPTVPACDGGREFVGWTASATLGGTKPSDLFTTASNAPTVTKNTTYYAAFATATSGAGTKTDNLTLTTTGVSGNSYANFTGKTATSVAVYAGNCAGGNSTTGATIQLRTTNSNSGIVTTTSGGIAKTISVTWNSNTASGRTLYIYGSNTAYGSAADLYATDTQGTLLGTIVNETSTSLTISGNYKYIGIRSNSGALYLDQINIAWGEISYSGYYTACSGNELTETTIVMNESMTVGKGSTAPVEYVISEEYDGTLTYSSADESVATVSSTGVVTGKSVGETTITVTAPTTGTCLGTSETIKVVVTNTQYNITWMVNGQALNSGEQTTKAVVGSRVETLPTTPGCASSRTFVGWTTSSTVSGNNEPAVLFTTASKSPLITGNTTFYAVFATLQGTVTGDYVLVEEDQDDWSGDYLIVYNNTYAMNTHSGNQNANTFATYTDISGKYDNKVITSEETTDTLVYRVAQTTNGYSLYCVRDNSYLGITKGTTKAGAQLRWNTAYTDSVCEWTICLDSIKNVGSPTLHLQWNNSTSSYRFAVYAKTQKSVQLFKKESEDIYIEYSLSPEATRKYTVSTGINAAGYGTISRNSITEVEYGTSISTNGNVLTIGEETVTATVTPASAEYTYTFVNWTWSPEKNTVTEDVTATANFNREKNKYQIRFLNWNGAVLQSEMVEYGAVPTYGATPVKEITGYTCTFTGWDETPTAVTGAKDYTAQYNESVNSYNLTWNLDGGTIVTEGTAAGSVAYGTAITAPTVKKAGYTFAGWSSTVATTMPAEAVTYTATWTEKSARGTVYAGNATCTPNQSIAQFSSTRSSYPNAIMIIGETYAADAQDETNVIIDYLVGTGKNLHFYECPRFVLTDKKDFYSPYDFVAVNGSYNRTIYYNMNSICMPFDVTSDMVGASGQLLTFAYYEPIYNNGTATGGMYVYFNDKTAEGIPAGTPCFVYQTVDYPMSINFSNTTIVGEPNNSGNLKGTFVVTPTNNNHGEYVINGDGTKLTHLENYPQTIKAFRTILSLAWDSEFNGGSNHNTQSSAPEHLDIRIIGEDGIVTDLDGVAIDNTAIQAEKNLPTYSIDGKLVGEISGPGLYIVNGKVVFINK